jgi:hypothetical protein
MTDGVRFELSPYLKNCPYCWQNFVRSVNRNSRTYPEMYQHIKQVLEIEYNALSYIDSTHMSILKLILLHLLQWKI